VLAVKLQRWWIFSHFSDHLHPEWKIDAENDADGATSTPGGGWDSGTVEYRLPLPGRLEIMPVIA
jgi:hypothetical protein